MNRKLLLKSHPAIVLFGLVLLLAGPGTLKAQCPDPTGLTASNITGSTADLSWDSEPLAVNYRVAYRPENTSPWTEIAVVATTSFSPTGLLSGTTYEWGVRVLCAAEDSEFIFGTNFTTSGTPACEIASNLTSNVLSETSAQVSWDVANGATDYRVIYWIRDGLGDPENNESTSPNALSVEVSTNTATLTGLQSGTTYIWTVRTLCSGLGIESTLPAKEEFLTNGTVRCEDPTTLLATPLTSTSVNLSWTSGNGAEEYRVGYKLLGEEDFSDIITVTSTSLNVVNLTDGETYEWGVRVLCPIENTVSELISGPNFVVGNPCSDPTGLTVSNILSDSARFDWNPVSGAVSYTVRHRRAANPAWTEFTGITDTTFQASALQSGTDYEWEVQAICATDMSAFVRGPDFTTLGVSLCDDPTGHAVANIMDNSADLSWNAATGATGYRVSYRESGEATWLATVEVVTTSYTPTGLVPGTTYEWAVRTLCDDIPTESSLVFGPDFTTTGSVVCDDPTNHTVTNLTNNSVTLSWDPANGAVNYRIAYRPTTESQWDQIIVQADTSLDVTGLSENTTYVWAVRTLCAETDSELIFGTNFTTLGGVPCDDPANLQTSNITSSSVSLAWDAASGSVEYRIAYRQKNAGGAWDAIIEQAGTTLNLAGLSAGTTYEWAVRNLCANEETSDLIFGPDFTTTGGVACEDPTNLQTSNIGSTTVTLTWNAAGGAVNYRIAYRPVNSGGSWEAIIEQPGTTLNATGLSSGTTYEWAVRTLCSGTETSDLIFGPEFTTSGTIDGSSAISINDKDDAGALLDADFRNSVHVYPNPSSGQFNIKVGTVSPNDQLVVYNALGKVLMTQRLESRSATLDLAGFGKGMYLVRVLNEERITSKTLIVR